MRSASRPAGRSGWTARAFPGCAAAAALTVAVAACGSADSPGPGAGGPAGGGTRPAASGCQVRIVLDTADAGIAVGSSLMPLEFTNVSPGRCRLTGYPAVAFVSSASGHRVGAAARADRALTPRPVVLAPGATAHAWLQVADAQNYPAAQCHPVTAGGLRVSLPGRPQSRYLRHAFAACATRAHAGYLLTVQPIEPGPARRGAAR